MTDRNTGGDRREAAPERIAVYDRPGHSTEPDGPAGWLIPAAVVLLLVAVLLWWL